MYVCNIMANNDLFDGPQRKRKKGQNQLNPAIVPPYTQKWPDVQKQHQKMILDEVKAVFHERLIDQWLIKKKCKVLKNGNLKARSVEDSMKVLKDMIGKQEKYVNKDVEKLLSTLDDPGKIKGMKQFKLYASIGANDIGRLMEKDSSCFSLIATCASVEWLCQGLLCQALLAGVPVCKISGLSDVLGEYLDMNSISAIAFKKIEESPFNDLVNFIVDKIPDVSSSWTRLWKGKKVQSEISGDYLDLNFHWKERKKRIKSKSQQKKV